MPEITLCIKPNESLTFNYQTIDRGRQAGVLSGELARDFYA